MVKEPEKGNYLRENGMGNPLALHEQIETLLSDDQRQRCVLLVDQFEETFTQTKDDEVRAAFIDLLTTAAQATEGRIIILLSLRSDFISHCARFPNLRSLMSQQFQLVGAMDAPDLAKAITLPALEVGAKIDAELVSRIMADMKGEPGALPLMSFALRDLFDAEKSTKGEPMDLLLPEYVERGGIESALERHANKVFDNFTDEQKGLARGVFSKLIEVGQGRADTRRTAALNELIPAGTEQEAVEAVVNALAKEGVRLITTSGGETAPTPSRGQAVGGSVTIAHEKLIDAWPWLRQLVDENRDMIILQNQISTDAQEWKQKEDAGYLYRGGRLIQVEEQLETSAPDLNKLSQQFIQVSLDQRQKEIEEKEVIQRRELEQAQALAAEQQQRAEEQTAAAKRLRSRNILFAGAAVAAVALAVVAFISFGTAQTNLSDANMAQTAAASNLADAQTNLGDANVAQTAAANNLVDAQNNLVTATRALATSEAAEATSEARLIEAESANATADAERNIAQSRFLANASLSVGHENGMRTLLLAIEAGQQTTTTLAFTALYTQLPFMPPLLQNLSHENRVNGAVWNEDESQILTWSNGGTANLWDAASGDLLRTLSNEGWEVKGAAWNEDESQILTWSDDVAAKLWDAASGELIRTLSHEGVVGGTTWNEDESQILTWGFGMGTLWDAASGELIQTLLHEDSWVKGAVWNKDESQILTWSDDGTAKLWDAASGAPLQTLSHQGSEVLGAVWNQGESQILTWSRDGTAKLWDAASGDLIQTLLHEGVVWGAVWNEDESQVLTWSADGTTKLWDATSGGRVQTLPHEDLVWGAVWNEDGSQILTWSRDGTAKLWDAASGDLLQTLLHGTVFGAIWNADESQILTWGGDGTAKLWDAASGNLLRILSHKDWVEGADWNEDESQILTWSADGTVKLWDAVDGGAIQTLSHENSVWGAAWNEDESQVLTWSLGMGTLWDAASGELIQTLSHEGLIKVNGAIWNEDESQILTWGGHLRFIRADGAGTAKLWDAASGDLLQTLPHEDEVRGAVWNKDESQILTWSRDGTAKLWDAASGDLLRILSQEGFVEGAVWNKDESQILTWGGDGTARLWDAVGLPLQTLSQEGVLNVVNGAAWNEDESQILTWNDGGTTNLWDAASGELIQTVNTVLGVRGAAWNEDGSQILIWGHEMSILLDVASGDPIQTLPHKKSLSVFGATWNEDESQILTWSADGTVKLWDAASGELIQTLSHEGVVRHAAWNEDESQILTWSNDGTAKLWDAKTGYVLLIINPDGTPITDARWSQNEERLLIATDGGIVRIYYTVMDDLVDAACQLSTRNFTLEEWQLYFPGAAYRRTCAQWLSGEGAPTDAPLWGE